jgi:hypothetical protein
MANKNIERFVETYGPVAQQVSKEINVDPNVLIGQWGLESRWGQTEMAKKHHNLGGIKDFSGHGHEAKDNKTGSVDKYVKFEDPEVFGMYYADQIKRNFPNAVNTGPDAGAFTRGLASGKYGSYYGVPQSEYLKSLTGAQAAIPADKQIPFEPTAVKPPEEATGENDMVTAPAPPAPPPTADTSGASPGQRFLGGALGTGVGVVSTGAQGLSSARTSAAANRAAAEEAARIRMQRAAAAAEAAAAEAAARGAPGPVGGPPQSVVRIQQPTGPLQLGTPGTYPTATGPGSGTFNYARKAGLTEIEAAKALDQTKQAGGAHDLLTQRREALNKIKQMGGGFVENPLYGGLMTPEQSVGSGPRASYTSTPGGLQQLPKTVPIPTTPPAPSGLQQVTTMFSDMMRPVASGLKTAGRYVLPPLAGLSAGLDAAEMAHEYDKPADQRDYTKMGLKGMGLVGGALSMFPPTMPLGVGMSLAAPALEYTREKGWWGDKKPEQVAPAP